jgi:LysM repeat protein
MKKQPEPLAELLWQEFPNTDPIELDKILKQVKQWLEQKQQYYQKLTNQIGRKLGKTSTQYYISMAYIHCIEALTDEIILATWKHDT